MNLNLNLSVDEVTQLNNEVEVARDDIDTLIRDLKADLNELKLNVHGNAVNYLFNDIEEKLATIKSDMSGSFSELVEFLDQQMKNYTDVYQQALEMLQKAFTFINEKIGTSGGGAGTAVAAER